MNRLFLYFFLIAFSIISFVVKGQESINDQLFKAVWHKDTLIINYLLKKGADVNARNSFGETPLFTTCCPFIVKLLLNSGADIDAQNLKGNTPLHSLGNYDCNSDETFKLLLKARPDVNIQNTEGKTPLHTIDLKYLDCIIRNYNEINFNLQDEDGNTILHRLSESNQREAGTLIRRIVNYGASLEIKNKLNQTPLLSASTENIKILIELGADINVKNQGGVTPLHLACKRQHQGVIEELLKRGADVNAKEIKGVTPLFAVFGASISPADTSPVILCLSGRIRKEKEKHKTSINLVKILLSYPVNINEVLPDSTTVLSLACHEGDLEIVKLLLSKGANHRINRNQIFSEALRSKNFELVKLLVDQGINPDLETYSQRYPIYFSIGPAKIVQLLIERGALVNSTQGYSGVSALHYAVMKVSPENIKDRIELIELFITHGADINAKDKFGRVPYYHFLNFNEQYEELSEMNEYLISKGVDINTRDNEGKAFLHHFHRDKYIVNFLLSKGANVNERDDKGKTVLAYVEEEQDKEMIHFLKSKGARL